MPAAPEPDAAAHWRRVAEERRAAHEALARRPLVRAAVAVERRTAPLAARSARARQRARSGLDRAVLAARALPVERRARAELGALEAAVASMPPAPVTVEVARVELPADASALVLDARLRALDASVAVVVPAGVVLLAGAEARLAAAIADGAAVAVPTVVHGVRPRRTATPVDGRTLAAGLDLHLEDGVPVPVPRRVGEPAAPEDEPSATDAALATGAALDVAAVLAAGGVAPVGDLDVAVVELVDRLVARGRRAVVVPAAVAVDPRPPGSAAAIDRPVDPTSTAWARALDRRGASLRRRAGGAGPGLDVAITIAAPSAKVAARWGDQHLASALGTELVRLGHRATVRTLDHADDPIVRVADVHLVVRGLRAVRATPGQRQVLWIISHPLDVGDDELDAADLVLVASATHAAALARRTSTPVEVLLQATDHRRFRPVEPVAAHRHDVTIVAKSREQLRPMVTAAIDAGLAPAIYGGGWDRLVDPALVVAEHVPNEELPAVYCSAGVVLNDHWDDMRELGFVSNRIFDVLACGAPVVSDHLPELVDLLGDVVPTWRRAEELAPLVAADLADPEAARARAARGRELVLAHHTFERRAAELVDVLERHGLVPTAGS